MPVEVTFLSIDADLQQDPEIVRNMVNILEEKPDIDVVAAYQHSVMKGKLMSWCKDRFTNLSTVSVK